MPAYIQSSGDNKPSKIPPLILKPYGCRVCGITTKLTACSECQALYYCSEEHKKQDEEFHKSWCFSIAEQRASYASALYGSHPVDIKAFEAIDVNELDRDTRSDIISSSAFVRKIFLASHLNPLPNGEAQDEYMEHLRFVCTFAPKLPPKSAPTFETLAAHLMLRGRDEECHRFIQQMDFVFAKRRDDYCLSYDGILNWDYDPFNGGLSYDKLVHPTTQVFLWLIRYRLLAEFERLQATREALGRKLPVELTDMVQEYISTNEILVNHPWMVRGDFTYRIGNVRAGLQQLCSRVHRYKRQIWPFVLGGFDPEGDHDCTKPSILDPELIDDLPYDHCTGCLRQVYTRKGIVDVLRETPGAESYLRYCLNIAIFGGPPAAMKREPSFCS